MTNRWMFRILGGASSLALSVVMVMGLAYSGVLSSTSLKAAARDQCSGSCNSSSDCGSGMTCCTRTYPDGSCNTFCASACPAD